MCKCIKVCLCVCVFRNVYVDLSQHAFVEINWNNSGNGRIRAKLRHRRTFLLQRIKIVEENDRGRGVRRVEV